MSHIFVSYKKEDRARVQRLVDALKAEGLSIWWDVDIEAGAAWREAIETALDAAACVVVVWSSGSIGTAGHFVQDEAARAERRGVYLPIAIDEVSPPLGFGQKQTISLVGWRGNRRDPRFADLRRAIAGVMGVAQTAPRAPARRLWPGFPPLPAGAMVAIGIGMAAAAILTLAVLGRGMRTARAPPNSIAVKPFTNVGGDPAQEYFSDGLSDELISHLARTPRLQVAARTSSFKLKGLGEDNRAMAAKLGVTYVLEGSVRRNANLVRVSAHLIDAKTGFERWSHVYDRDAKDALTVESGIAEDVADALDVRLGGADRAELGRGGPTSPAAYDDYLRGQLLSNAGAGELSHRDALASFDAALAIDPRFAAAHAARAKTLVFIANQFAPARDLRATYDEAIASARRALELAPRLAEAQAALADALVYGDRDFRAAKLVYARALADGGDGNAEVLLGYGQLECELGDTATGLAALQRAVTLDPLNARAFKSLGLGLIYAHQYPRAIDAMRRALALSPGISGARAGIGEALLLSDHAAEAQSEYELEPVAWQRLTGEAIVRRRLGDMAGAAQARDALIAAGRDESSYQLAEIEAQWRDPDAAFAALDSAFRVGDAGVELLAVDPLLTPLRHDRRYAKAVAKAGLAD